MKMFTSRYIQDMEVVEYFYDTNWRVIQATVLHLPQANWQ